MEDELDGSEELYSDESDDSRRVEQTDSSSEDSDAADSAVPSSARAHRCAWDVAAARWVLYPSCAAINEAALGDMEPIYN